MEKQKMIAGFGRWQQVAAGVGLAVVSGASMATTPAGVTAAVTALNNAGTSISTIGAAMVAAAAAGIVFRWVTAFLVK